MRLAKSPGACGGYFLTVPTRRPQHLSSTLLPAAIVSLSDCICDFIPSAWAVEWADFSREERLYSASKFGLSEGQLDEVIAWTTRRIGQRQLGWPSTFFSLETARDFAGRFLLAGQGLAVYGIAMHENDLERFLSEEVPPSGQATPGVFEAVGSGMTPAPGGKVLGWEVLGYEDGWFHSWLCNGLEVEVAEELNVRPNDRGFISCSAEAAIVAEYCGREEVGAEPAFWAAWQVREYSVGDLASAA